MKNRKNMKMKIRREKWKSGRIWKWRSGEKNENHEGNEDKWSKGYDDEYQVYIKTKKSERRIINHQDMSVDLDMQSRWSTGLKQFIKICNKCHEDMQSRINTTDVCETSKLYICIAVTFVLKHHIDLSGISLINMDL